MFYLGLPLGIGTQVDSSNYVFVIVDWRGFYGSAAAAIPQPNRGEDGYDVIDWIALQPWCNGNVGTWGPSALGVVQYQTAREQHPNHKCAVPLVASPEFNYEEYYPGGVYRTEYVQQLDALGYGLSGILLANQVHNLVWNFSEASTFYPADITIPCFMIGGWYDHTPTSMLTFFDALKLQSPAAADHKILMGPWVHGGNGTAYVGSATQGELSYPGAAGWSDSLAVMFLDYYLRGINNGTNTWADMRYFQMGDDQWQTTAFWPPAGISNVNLYLHSGGILGPSTPSLANSFSGYNYTASDPSPTIGGPTLRMDLDQGPYDQVAQVESRNDILIFSTPPQPSPVMLKGQGTVHLFVSSDRKDTDFSVRVTDVYPDGRSMLLLDGIRRGRFRDGFAAADTAIMQQGQIYEMVIDLPPTAHTFLPGHRIRLDITSSNYPRFDCNLNNGGAMYTAGDTLTATNRVYHDVTYASYIELPLNAVPVGTTETEITTTVGIMPNPAEDQIFISLSSAAKAEIIIYDLQGKLIHQASVSSQTSVNIENWPAGEYILKTKTGNEIHTQKFIKK
jgi:uncharacterized protein